MPERIVLRKLHYDDLEMIRKWRNEHLEDFFDHTYITEDMQERWYANYSVGNDYHFIIELKNGIPIGQVALVNVGDGSAELVRLLILEDYQNCGYATEAVQALIDYAHNILAVRKIKLMTKNPISAHLYEKVGFKVIDEPRLPMEIDLWNGTVPMEQ